MRNTELQRGLLKKYTLFKMDTDTNNAPVSPEDTAANTTASTSESNNVATNAAGNVHPGNPVTDGTGNDNSGDTATSDPTPVTEVQPEPPVGQ